jgi:hypothetical protein
MYLGTDFLTFRGIFFSGPEHLVFTPKRNLKGRPGRDSMVVEFTTTLAISVYHHYKCEFESRS